MIDTIKNAGEKAHEAYWQLPLDAHLEASVKGEIADLKNIADGVRAGSSVGAAFIAKFVKKASFTHLDIAGPSYLTAAYDYRTAGGTGFGTLTFIELMKRGFKK